MSALVHTVAQAVASPLPSPTVVPTVTKEIINNVKDVPVQVPSYVLQLAQTLALAGATAFVSLVHALADKGRWSAVTNRLVVTTYSLLAALALWFLTKHVGVSTNDLQALLTNFLVALGAALGSYNLVLKSVLQAFGWTAPAGTDQTALATDPANGVG